MPTGPSATDPFGYLSTTLASKYAISSVAGSGGFATVYRGHHLSLDVPIAIKCLRIDHAFDARTRQAFLDSFLAEGRLLHRLSRATSSIVQAMDMGAEVSPSGIWTPYLVLEWLDGETLETALAERFSATHRGYGLAEATSLLEPIARGLELAHAEGIAHRDVKPANIFLSRVGTMRMTKLLDFGIAKVMADAPPGTTQLGTPKALTPYYAAPEQFDRAIGATGPWSDVYALARVWVECVVGHGLDPGLDSLALFRLASDATRRPTLAMFGLEEPPGVDRVLRKALAVDPNARYRTAGELWDALSQAVSRAPEPAPKTRLPVTIGQTAVDDPHAHAHAPAPTVDVLPPPAAAAYGPTTSAGAELLRAKVIERQSASPSRRDSSPPATERSESRGLLVRIALAVVVIAVVAIVVVATRGSSDSGTTGKAAAAPIADPEDDGPTSPKKPHPKPHPLGDSPKPKPNAAIDGPNDGTDPLRPRLPPEDEGFVDTRGGWEWGNRCYRNILNGHYGFAKAECDEAMKLSPESPQPRASLLYNLGLIEKAAGNKENARSLFEQSLALRENKEVRDALDSL